MEDRIIVFTSLLPPWTLCYLVPDHHSHPIFSSLHCHSFWSLFPAPSHWKNPNHTWTPYLPSELGDLIPFFKYILHADNSKYLSPEGLLLWILNLPSGFHINCSFCVECSFPINSYNFSSLNSLFKYHLLSEVFSELLVYNGNVFITPYIFSMLLILPI